MKFQVAFYNKSPLVVSRMDGMWLLDRAKMKFPDIDEIEDIQNKVINQWFINVPESLARASGLFETSRDVSVRLSPDIMGKFVGVRFEKSTLWVNKQFIVPYVTIKEEELLEAWQIAGYPMDWNEPEVAEEPEPEQEPEVAEEPEPEVAEEPEPEQELIVSEIETKTKQIIAKELGVSEDEVTPQASFVDDLGANSMDQVELIIALENEFGLEIPDEDVGEIKSVKDALSYIESKKRSKPEPARKYFISRLVPSFDGAKPRVFLVHSEHDSEWRFIHQLSKVYIRRVDINGLSLNPLKGYPTAAGWIEVLMMDILDWNNRYCFYDLNGKLVLSSKNPMPER